MIHVAHLTEIPRTDEFSVIINCGTKWVSTLALLAALRYVGGPVLIIDCESMDGSSEHFRKLAAAHELEFYWVDWPLRPHPTALNQLFSELEVERVLLIDSDLEILSPDIANSMRAALLTEHEAYGAGFLHGPTWLGSDHGMYDHAGYYAERMWIPCVMLRRRHILNALSNGIKFDTRRTFHDFKNHPRLSSATAWRHKLPFIRRQRLWRPSDDPMLRHALNISDVVPSFVEYDTGADIHAWLKSVGKHFHALPAGEFPKVQHYHGVTRAALGGRLLNLALLLRGDRKDVYTKQQEVETSIRTRLSTDYGISEAATGQS